jgi:hypothetical protein
MQKDFQTLNYFSLRVSELPGPRQVHQQERLTGVFPRKGADAFCQQQSSGNVGFANCEAAEDHFVHDNPKWLFSMGLFSRCRKKNALHGQLRDETGSRL